MEKYINDALVQFEKILRRQLERADAMRCRKAPKEFTVLDTITIGLVGGDGIGPIIMTEAKRLLETLLKEEIASGKVILMDIEGLTLENRMENRFFTTHRQL